MGDVKEEFLQQLKQKMRQKLQHFSLENEKASESQCELFLAANYEPIAHKLSNNEYQRLDALSREIKDFLQYYMDEGPRGPFKQVIGQEFAYKALAEGSDFFFKSAANELSIQEQLFE